MNLILQIQKLEPGSEIMLFELDGSEFGADVLRFHGHAIPHTPQELAAAGANADQLPAKSIWWQGQEYAAWPVQISGIEAGVRPAAMVRATPFRKSRREMVMGSPLRGSGWLGGAMFTVCCCECARSGWRRTPTRSRGRARSLEGHAGASKGFLLALGLYLEKCDMRRALPRCPRRPAISRSKLPAGSADAKG